MSSNNLTPEQEAKIVQDIVGAPKPTKEVVEPLELHDSEIAAASKILADLHFRYKDRTGTHANLMSLKGEAEEKFLAIGLEVQVDWITASLTGEPPTITIIDRVTPFETGRQYHDVNKGVADKYWAEQRKIQEAQRKKKKNSKVS